MTCSELFADLMEESSVINNLNAEPAAHLMQLGMIETYETPFGYLRIRVNTDVKASRYPFMVTPPTKFSYSEKLERLKQYAGKTARIQNSE